MRFLLKMLTASTLLAAAWLTPSAATAQTKVPGYEPGEEKAEDFPAGAGRDETFYACIACHNFKLVAAQRLTRNGWDETITLMTQKHNMPAVEGDERKVILDYLSTAFAPDPSQQRGWKNPFSQ
jgi:mono/diheme cytochrome c family protein